MYKKHDVLKVNILFLLIGILILTIGSYYQSKDLDTGLLITEYILVLIPVLIFIAMNSMDIKRVLRLNKISLEQVVYIVAIMMLAYSIGAFLNNIASIILNLFFEMPGGGVPLPTDIGDYMKSLFIVAITAGICEEALCRGLLLNIYERLGRKKSLLITSILFAALHFNLYNFIGPMFLGYVLGVLVYKTDSLFAGILGHTLNNGIAISLGYYFVVTGKFDMEVVVKEPNLASNLLSITWSMALIFCLGVALKWMLNNFPKTKEGKNDVDYAGPYNVECKVDAYEYIPISIFIIIFIGLNGMVLI